MKTWIAAAGALALFLPWLASADTWSYVEEVDPMTDAARRSAVVSNEHGHQFKIYTGPDGGLWANFSLGSRDIDVLAMDRMPRYRIDNAEPVDLQETVKVDRIVARYGGGGSRSIAAEPKWVNFRLWGSIDPRLSKRMLALMNGERVLFQYYLATGGSKYSEFQLSGARESILRVAGAADPVEPEAARQLDAQFAAYWQALEECEAQSERRARQCKARVFECGKMIGSDTASQVDSCLSG